MPALSLFQNRWWIPFAGCLGIMVGIGPALMGATFDRAHSDDPMLLIFFFALLVTVVPLAILGPTPIQDRVTSRSQRPQRSELPAE